MIRIWFVMLLVMLAGSACSGEDTTVRPYLKTGNWYPANSWMLQRTLKAAFENVSPSVDGTVRGLVLPHAGYAYSGNVAAHGVSLLKEQHVTRVILLGVAHRSGFDGACVSGYQRNRTPLGDIPLDRPVIDKLAQHPLFKQDDRIMVMEHSIENQLPLLQYVLGDTGWKAVPILIGRLDPVSARRIAAAILPHMDAHTVVVASSDLTHHGPAYGFTPYTTDVVQNVRQLDHGFLAHVVAMDLDGMMDYRKETGITVCGIGPLQILMRLMKELDVTGSLLGYTNSGELDDSADMVVGYGSVGFYEKNEEVSVNANGADGLSGDLQQRLLKLSREILEQHVREGYADKVHPEDYPMALRAPRSVFVTLRKNGSLRGCIGNLGNPAPLAVSVRDYTINAASFDPRFPPVASGELPKITIEISVMTPMQEVASYKLVRLGTDGVVIQSGGRGAVYLPQVATETGWSLDELMGNLCRKAGLPMDAYRKPGMKFFTFQAQVFHETD